MEEEKDRDTDPKSSRNEEDNNSPQPLSKIATNPSSVANETIYETAARLLDMTMKWAKNLPSFTVLSFRDQVRNK